MGRKRNTYLHAFFGVFANNCPYILVRFDRVLRSVVHVKTHDVQNARCDIILTVRTLVSVKGQTCRTTSAIKKYRIVVTLNL